MIPRRNGPQYESKFNVTDHLRAADIRTRWWQNSQYRNDLFMAAERAVPEV